MNLHEERKAGDYTIRESLRIGNKEIVLGENMSAEDGLFYLVGNYESNELFERYTDVLVGDDYAEMVSIFADRIKQEAERLIEETKGYPTEIILSEDCLSISDKNLKGEVIVINPMHLRPEYRKPYHQIMRCVGGNGANPNGIGTSVFCKGFLKIRSCVSYVQMLLAYWLPKSTLIG